jgi:hypothetical protein
VLAELTRVEKENIQMLSMPASSAQKIQQFEVSPTSVIIMSNNGTFDFADHTKIVRTLSDSVTVSSSDDEDEKERALAEVERVANAMAQLDDLSPSTQGSKESRNESSSSSAASCNLAKPSLRKRNTCGTLYVGSTMSAPDKDATIKVKKQVHFCSQLECCSPHVDFSVYSPSCFTAVHLWCIPCTYSSGRQWKQKQWQNNFF